MSATETHYAASLREARIKPLNEAPPFVDLPEIPFVPAHVSRSRGNLAPAWPEIHRAAVRGRPRQGKSNRVNCACRRATSTSDNSPGKCRILASARAFVSEIVRYPIMRGPLRPEISRWRPGIARRDQRQNGVDRGPAGLRVGTSKALWASGNKVIVSAAARRRKSSMPSSTPTCKRIRARSNTISIFRIRRRADLTMNPRLADLNLDLPFG